MRRALIVVLALAGCAHSRGASEGENDPDLQPLEPIAREQAAAIEPDEVIGTPDAPGADLIGAPETKPIGPTQHVVMEGEAATAPAVAGQPKRPKRGSFMTGIRYAPNK